MKGKKKLLACVAAVLALSLTTPAFAGIETVYNTEYKEDVSSEFTWNDLDTINSATPDNCSFTIKLTYNVPVDTEYDVYMSLDGEEKKKVGTGVLSAAKKETEFTYKLPTVTYGVHESEITVEINGKEMSTFTKPLAVIKKYEKQFMDKYSTCGINLHVGRWDITNDQLADFISEAGIMNMRDGIRWYALENSKTGKGVSEETVKANQTYQFSKKMNERGVSVLQMSNGLSDLYYGGEYEKDYQSAMYECPPLSYDVTVAWAEYNKKLYEYAGDTFTGMEFLNEKNGPSYTAARYTNQMMQTAVALKKSGYTGALDAFCLYNHYENEFVREGLDSGIYPYMTAISFHPYGFGGGENFSDVYKGTDNNIQEKHKILMDYGGWTDLDITEIGSATFGASGVTDESQAVNLVKDKFKIDKDNIQTSHVYDFMDDGTAPFDRESNFGLIEHPEFGRTPKKGYAAYAQLNRETNGAVQIGTVDMGEHEGQMLAYVYLKDGEPLVIVWDNNPKDELNRSFEFKGETVSVTDMYGNELGEFTDFIDLTRQPLYLHGFSKDWLVKACLHEVSDRADEWIEYYGKEISEELTQKAQGVFDEVKATLKSGVTADVLASDMDKLDALGMEIIAAGKNGEYEQMRVSSMLFKLYELMSRIGRTYAGFYNGELKAVETDIKAAQAEADEKYGNDFYVMQYSDQILRHAKRYIEKAEYALTDGDNPGKAGIVRAYDILGGKLVNWFSEFSDYEHSYNYGLISMIQTSKSRLDTAYDGQKLEKEIKVLNEGKKTFRGTIKAYALDNDELVYESDEFAVDPSGTKDVLVILPCDMQSGQETRKFKLDFVNKDGYVEATRTHEVQISSLADMSIEDCLSTPEETKAVKIDVTNLFATNTAVKIELSTSDNLTLAQSSIDVQLGPNETKVVEVPIKEIKQTAYSHYVVDYKLYDTKGFVIKQDSVPLSFVSVVKATKKIDPKTWNGDVSDWYDAYPIYRGSVTNASDKEAYVNADFLSRMMLKWDEEHLYMLVENYDDTHSVLYTGQRLWDGDALQVSLDPIGDGGSPYQEDDYEIGFALTGIGSDSYQWSGPKKAVEGQVDWVKIIRVPETRCTKYLIALPVKDFDYKALEENSTINFNIAINEGDVMGRDEFFQITTGTANAKKPDDYYDYKLVMPKTFDGDKTNPLP